MKKYVLVFDKKIIKQLKKTDENNKIILSKKFDKLENLGPKAGKLIDSRFHIYQIKLKSPPLRLYYTYEARARKIKVFEFEMKKL